MGGVAVRGSSARASVLGYDDAIELGTDPMGNLKWLAAALVAAAITPAFAGGDESQDSRQQSLVLHFRSYYFDREKPVPPDSKASVWGGWIGYDSGWLYDRFKLSLTGYGIRTGAKV